MSKIEEANAKLRAIQDRKNAWQRDKEQRDIVYALLRNSKKRARARGLEWNLTRSDISVPTLCPILGIPLRKNRGTLSKDSPSLDRVDNSKGYVPGNVQVISFWANTMKDNLTLEQIERLYLYVKGEL